MLMVYGCETRRVMDQDRILQVATSFSPDISSTERILKAHISILCSALGGYDHDAKVYRMGIDALSCLKDIKRWIRTVDDRADSWDVAAACADCELLKNDLCVILAQWEEQSVNKQVRNANYMNMMCLAVLELLVALTKPLALNAEKPSMAKLDVYARLKKFQVSYKAHVLNYKGGLVLKAVLRLAVPALKIHPSERSARDMTILKLCITFCSNIAGIVPANKTVSKRSASKYELGDNMPPNVSLEDISMSTVIDVYQRNRVLQFLQTMCAHIDYNTRVLAESCLEVIHRLVEDVEYTAVGQASSLGSLLAKEGKIKRKVQAGSRHSNFGTLISVPTDKGTSITLSGQTDMSKDPFAKFDDLKKWAPPRLSSKLSFHKPKQRLNNSAKPIFHKFAMDFVEYGFNPLIGTVQKQLEEANQETLEQFFLTISWFLRFYRENGMADFGFLASALNEVTYVMVIRNMREFLDQKEWKMVYILSITLKELLLTANAMMESPEEEFSTVGGGIIRTLFENEETLLMVAHLCHNAYKISDNYLFASADLCHVVLKTLENFSKKSSVALYVRSKRRRKRTSQHHGDSESEDYDPSARALDFKKVEKKFLHDSIIDSFVVLLSKHQEVDDVFIKRCLQYFHRVFIKCQCHTPLFRLDFMFLLRQITSTGHHDGWESFTKYYMKVFMQKASLVNSLFTEVAALSTNREHSFFLESGEMVTKEPARLSMANDLAFVQDFSFERKIAIAVAALIDKGGSDSLEWLICQLDKRTIFASTEEQRKWLVTDAEVRLVLQLCGFHVPQYPDDDCYLKGDAVDVDMVKKCSTEPFEDENDRSAGFYLKAADEDEIEQDFDDFLDVGTTTERIKLPKTSRLKSKKPDKTPKAPVAKTAPKSSKYIDDSDSEDELFWAKEDRLREFLEINQGKPLTTEQAAELIGMSWESLQKRNPHLSKEIENAKDELVPTRKRKRIIEEDDDDDDLSD